MSLYTTCMCACTKTVVQKNGNTLYLKVLFLIFMPGVSNLNELRATANTVT